jgi:hypothetical protein
LGVPLLGMCQTHTCIVKIRNVAAFVLIRIILGPKVHAVPRAIQ